MWYSAHECKCGAKPLLQSTLLTYCYQCEVYWVTEKVIQRSLEATKNKAP